MNWDRIEDNWTRIKGNVIEQWDISPRTSSPAGSRKRMESRMTRQSPNSRTGSYV